MGNDAERLEVIAQIIAECDGKPRVSQAYTLCPWPVDVQAATSITPLSIILCLSTAFLRMAGPLNFSCSKETQLLLLSAAAFLEIRNTAGMVWKYPTLHPWRLLFLSLQFRCACEMIFDAMLNAYIAGLKASYNRSQEKGKKQGSKRRNLDGWDQALQLAEHADDIEVRKGWTRAFIVFTYELIRQWDNITHLTLHRSLSIFDSLFILRKTARLVFCKVSSSCPRYREPSIEAPVLSSLSSLHLLIPSSSFTRFSQ